ncbi:MAG: AAA family ATPase [Candidatus Aenigmatarchaeota archaeon]
MVELPLRHPELFTRLGIEPPKGVLLYGPPGTGKTLLAKAVANESGANFISISGPEVMCVGPETPILTSKGLSTAKNIYAKAKENAKKIEKAKDRETIRFDGIGVFSLSPGMKIEHDKITEATKLKADKAYEVETEDGTFLKVSKNQPFAVLGRSGEIVWRKAEELKKGDYVASARKITFDGNPKIDWLGGLDKRHTYVQINGRALTLRDALEKYGKNKVEKETAAITFSSTKSNLSRANWIKPVKRTNTKFMRFLGSLYAEGCISSRMGEICFANSNHDYIAEMKEHINDLFGLNGSATKERDIRLFVYSRALANFLKNTCTFPVGKKKDMHLPPFIYECSKEQISAFISGYFDGDGTVSFGIEEFPTPRLYSISRGFLKELQGLLQAKLSMPSRVVPWKTPYGDLFALVVMGNDGRQIFFDNVLPFSLKKKEWKLSGKPSGEDIIPNVSPVLREIKRNLGLIYGKTIKESSIEPYISGRKPLTKRKLQEVLEIFKQHGTSDEITALEKIAESDIKFVKISKLEEVEGQELYDFGVEKNSNFLGGLPFLPLHNSKWYGESEKRIREIFQEAEKDAPSIIFIDEVDAIAPKREEVTGEVERRVVSQILSMMDGLKSRGKVIVIAATNRPNALDPALRRPGRFDREVEIGVPDVKGRLEVLQIHTRNMPLKDVDLKWLADVTYGFVGADLEALAKEAAMSALRRALPGISWKKIKELPPETLEKLKVTKQDFKNALKMVEPSAMREVLIEIPNVKWSDIGGLEEVKGLLKEVVQWPLKHPEAFKRMGIKSPSGVLLYGPPGSGKTLLAKAVANESGANFISVRGPEVFTMWVGESERKVREIFRRAKQVAPAIIFFDEVDALAPRRGLEAGARVTETVVSQILTEMSGLEELHNVVVIAATNRPDIVDPALLRPGRFDRQILVPGPDLKAREEIFKIYTSKMPVSKDVDAKKLAKETEGYTGADIEAVCREAGLYALRKDIKAKQVTRKHFEQALKKVGPSVNPKVIEFYNKMAEQFKAPAPAVRKKKEEELTYVG